MAQHLPCVNDEVTCYNASHYTNQKLTTQLTRLYVKVTCYNTSL